MPRFFCSSGILYIGSLLRVLPCLLLFLLLPGCAQNVVSLDYPPPKEAVVPNAGASTLCVVQFADKRTQLAIGQRRDGGDFQPRTDVASWVSRAMADELAQVGLSVTYAENMAAAMASHPRYIVTGIINEIWLTENSLTRYTSAMHVTIALLRGEGSHITKNNYQSTFSQTVMPTSDVPQTMLSEGLVDLLRPAARNIELSTK